MKDTTCKLQIEDRRNWRETGLNLPRDKHALYFMEGRNVYPDWTVVNRYGITPCETLVLLSIPPDVALLEKILTISEAGRLVLAFSSCREGTAREFLLQIGGMLKYAAGKETGMVEIPALAAATGQLEITVAAAIKFIRAKGWLKVEYLTPKRLLVRSAGENSVSDRDADVARVRLQGLLAENRAFHRYLNRSTVTDLQALLESGKFADTYR